MATRTWIAADVKGVDGGWQPTGNFSRRGTNDYAECRCACGTIRNVTLRSDGSLKGRMCSPCNNALAKRGTHGHARSGARGLPSPTYKVWLGMIQRSDNTNAKDYGHYGGRGIRVCDRWHDFALFLADMGERPDGLTIERIDNNRGYEPGNCRWATSLEQGRNKRNNVILTHAGRSMPISAWAAETGLGFQNIWNRHRSGWTDSDAVTKPIGPSGKKRIAHA